MKKSTDSRIVLALEQMSMERALKIAEEAQELVWGFKVSDLIFHYGAEIIYELKRFGNVVADVKLIGSHDEIKRAIKIFRVAGADVITVMSYLYDETWDDLARVGTGLNHCKEYAWTMDQEMEEEKTILVLRNKEVNLRIFGRKLIAKENFIEALEKINKELNT